MKQKIMWVAVLVGLLSLTGCASVGKLSEKKESFESKGLKYSIQLPDTWKISENPTEQYNAEAAFGAEDSKTNSSLYVLTKAKSEAELEDLGERTREELVDRHNLKSIDEVPMKEFEVGGFPGYRYKLEASYEQKKAWLYFYYVETETSLLQFVVYSAYDNQSEKREEVLDQAIQSVKETGISEETAVEDEQIIVENDEMGIEVTGLLTIDDNKKEIVAIRYAVTNHSNEKELKANLWKDQMKVSQNNQFLSVVSLSEEINRLDLEELIKNGDTSLKKGDTIDSVIFYELLDTSDISLQPNSETFPDSKSFSLVLP